MSRTIVEIPVKTQKVDEILENINSILAREEYELKMVDNEKVWAKGDGVIVLLQCFNVIFGEHSVIIQAWVKDALMGESNCEGFLAKMPKKKMKKLIEEIQMCIALKNL